MRLQFALRRNAGQQPNSANGKNVSLDFIQTVKPQKDLLLKKGLDTPCVLQTSVTVSTLSMI